MKKIIPFFTYLMLVAFLAGSMSPFSGMKYKGSKTAIGMESSTSDMEDCADSADLEDSEIENDLDDSKEVSAKSQLGFQKSLLMRWEHQMQLFCDHHSTIITPPPKG